MKRLFDVFASGFALLLLSPLLIPLAILLRLSGEGEIFYLQQRVGQGRKIFHIYKFATMLRDSPNLGGGDITIANDPRILPMGRFLRDTKINELPQLLNIFFGDMSVIGWRPLTPRVAGLFPDSHWQALRAWRPGLSGIGSIVFRDEEALLTAATDRETAYRTVIAPYKSMLEIWYSQQQSFLLDLKLIALTVMVVFKPNYDIRAALPGLPRETPELLAFRAQRHQYRGRSDV